MTFSDRTYQSTTIWAKNIISAKKITTRFAKEFLPPFNDAKDDTIKQIFNNSDSDMVNSLHESRNGGKWRNTTV